MRSLWKQNGITIKSYTHKKFKVWLLLATLYNTGEQTKCDRVMKQPALTPLCLYSARWRSACLCESVGEKRVVGELWVGDRVETSTTPPKKKKKKKVFLPSLDYLQTQEVVKKGGKEVVDKMFVYLKKKTCGINVCYDRTRYCIWVRKPLSKDFLYFCINCCCPCESLNQQ